MGPTFEATKSCFVAEAVWFCSFRCWKIYEINVGHSGFKLFCHCHMQASSICRKYPFAYAFSTFFSVFFSHTENVVTRKIYGDLEVKQKKV